MYIQTKKGLKNFSLFSHNFLNHPRIIPLNVKSTFNFATIIHPPPPTIFTSIILFDISWVFPSFLNYFLSLFGIESTHKYTKGTCIIHWVDGKSLLGCWFFNFNIILEFIIYLCFFLFLLLHKLPPFSTIQYLCNSSNWILYIKERLNYIHVVTCLILFFFTAFCRQG